MLVTYCQGPIWDERATRSHYNKKPENVPSVPAFVPRLSRVCPAFVPAVDLRNQGCSSTGTLQVSQIFFANPIYCQWTIRRVTGQVDLAEYRPAALVR
jgi:hypothetical protein